jgi:predicted outer membrane repeat protein
MKRIIVLIYLFLPCSFVNAVYAQTIYYVDGSQPNNSGNGLSWANAKKNIQDAITLASSGSEIWVKAGTYFPDEGTGLTNNDRTSTFLLKTDVKMYGSFVGTETLLSQRVIDLNNLTTILSGEIQQDTDSTNNAYHILTSIDLSASTLLNGMKVKLGYANGGAFNDKLGGGMFVNAQSQASNAMQMNNCVFENNYAANQGGAIYMSASAGKTISNGYEDVYFFNNKAGFDGGAVFAAGFVGSNLSSFAYCLFKGNKANSGAAMHIYANDNGTASLFLLFVVFDDNMATSDAGALSNYVAKGISNTELLFCTFTNNYAGGNAGAIFSIATLGTNNLKINNSNFTANKTAPTFSGGAVYILCDTTTAVNNTKMNKCKFTLNEAGYGGAVAYYSLKGTITSYIYQSLFTKNKADNSAAVDSYIDQGLINEFLVNCTITENIASMGSAVETYKNGIGNSTLQLVNSIVWNNSNGITASDIYFGSATDQLINSLVGNTNCMATGLGTCSNSLYAINPLFVNPVGDDYALQPCSPVINNGTLNASTAGMDATDFANNPRFVGIVDLGIYEYGSPTTITWLGGTSNNWGTASNWSPAVVPTACNDVIVNSGTPFLPVVNGIFYCRKLWANMGATVNVLTGSVLHVAGQ